MPARTFGCGLNVPRLGRVVSQEDLGDPMQRRVRLAAGFYNSTNSLGLYVNTRWINEKPRGPQPSS